MRPFLQNLKGNLVLMVLYIFITLLERVSNCGTSGHLYLYTSILNILGLAQEVLAACLDSVALAANLISSNPKKSYADGKLFEIKHLLILREQIIPFQSEFVVRESSLDFTKVKMIINWPKIVLFKSIRNSIRRNKGNFTSKFN